MYAETLKLIATARRRRPSPRLRRALDALLRRLADLAAPRPDRTEDAVWALWMRYPDVGAAAELERATRAIVAEDYPTAEAILRRLVALLPGFAEAWHKRATLYYMQGRDDESVRDFYRTLVLEPRHYGVASATLGTMRLVGQALSMATVALILLIAPAMTTTRASCAMMITNR
jgi:tetratricopeptide (TPR) repeat protein